jgi:NADH dehydrogenase/NADH:ubiquinone oxidoreductase subunit G
MVNPAVKKKYKSECQEAAARLAKCGTRKRSASGRFVKAPSTKRSKGAPFPKGPSASEVNMRKAKGPHAVKGKERASALFKKLSQPKSEPQAKKVQPKVVQETKKLDTEQEKKMKEMQSYISRLEKMVEEPKGLSKISPAMPQAMKNALEVANRVEKNIKKYSNEEVESDAQAIRDEVKEVKEKYERLQRLKKMRGSKLTRQTRVGDISALKKATRQLAQQVDKSLGRASKNFAQVGRKGPKPKFKAKKQNTGRSGKRR